MEPTLFCKLQQINVFTQKDQINKQCARILIKHQQIHNQIILTTDFLSNDASLRSRLFCIKNNINKQPTCRVCGVEVCFNGSKGRFNTYCPNSMSNCASQDPQLVKQIKNTTRARYGVDNALQNSQVKAKQTCTIRQRYGVDYPIQNAEINNKRICTLKKRYGVDNIGEIDNVRKKITSTNLARYGSPTYGESLVPKSAIDVLSNEIELQDLLQDNTISGISKLLNCSTHSVRRYINIHNLQQFNNNTRRRLHISDIHRDVINIIESAIDPELITINNKSKIPPYELDVFIEKYNLGFEINGVFFHSELSGRDKKYHLNKTVLCKNAGIRLVHINSNEILTKPHIVKSRIHNMLQFNKTIYARKCIIEQITTQEGQAFLDMCHIQGNAKARIYYGLFYQNELVGVMSFSKSRFSKKHQWELLRFSTGLNINVVGGASRLLKRFIQQHNPDNIVSYCDVRWGTGKLYEKLNFKYMHQSSPNYFYFKRNGDTNKLLNRVQFQKHKLKDKLEVFNPTLTEWQNMQKNGYDRIWDCGNLVFVWTK
jgi:hypothetical protein